MNVILVNGIPYEHDCIYTALIHDANAEDVQHDQEVLQSMLTLARNMAYHLKYREAAQKTGVPVPKR